MSTKLTLLFKTLFFISLAAISTLAFLPDYNALPPIVSFSDLLNHTVAFVVLFILGHFAYPSILLKHLTTALILYAFFIEAVQYFLPTRFASWSDISADIVGLVIAYITINLFRHLSYAHNPDS